MDKMYGVDKYGKVYVFDIISEYSNEIIAKITNSQSLHLSSVEFYIKPQENGLFYKIINCSNHVYDRFCKEYELFISKCKEDIIAKKYVSINEYYNNKIKEQEDLIKINNDMPNDINSSYNTLSLNNLELNDKIILLRNNKKYEAVVTSFTTIDKINFTPRISCENLGLEDIELNIKTTVNRSNELYFNLDNDEYSEILIFLDDIDLRNYRNYLSFKEYAEFRKRYDSKIEKLINKRDNEIKNIENF